MRRLQITYWITTVLAMLLGATSAFFYFTPFEIASFKHLGFPDYFRMELGAGKIIGLILLLYPSTPKMLKEWAYVGFGIVFTSAIVAHLNVDGLKPYFLAPMLPLSLLIASYVYYKRLQTAKAA